MTLSPSLPRPSDSAASRASRSSASVTPKLALAASVPAIDWNTRSTGAPCSMAAICVVTCVSTQLCMGMSKRRRMSSSICHSRCMAASESPAGLMPTTASPAPYSSPSSVLAAMPFRSSVG